MLMYTKSITLCLLPFQDSMTVMYGVQVFHLPADVFAEQPQPTASSSSEASISSFLAEGDERTAVDTGRWGQSDRKPSAFLSHDLWMRLGHT